jgi:hypothetical protein
VSKVSFRKYNICVIACMAAFIAAGGFGIWILDRIERLPPPPLTATFCIDEKFMFMRNTVSQKPDILAVGSSATWRNLDFSVLRGIAGSARPLNGAPCYLKVHETAFLTGFYLDNMPSVQKVISVFAMRDFENCRGNPAFFDPATARRYVFDGWPAWHLYFLNFRPRHFFRDVVNLPAMRSGSDVRNAINMDLYGSAPLLITPPEIREDVVTTPECFQSAKDLARELAARNIIWSVILMPPMPAWLSAYDPTGVRDRNWRIMVADRLKDTGAIVIDGRDAPLKDNENFTDPAHFHWSYVAAFSEWVFREIFAKREQVLSDYRHHYAL